LIRRVFMGRGMWLLAGGYPGSNADQTISPHSKAGKGNAIGNGSTDVTSGASSTSRDTAFCKYRGIENFWGNCNNWADGIVLYSEGNTAGNKAFAYWSNSRANFADVAQAAAATAIPAGFASLGEIANTLNATRYATQFELTNGWALVVKDFSTTSSHGTTDFYRTASGWRVLRVGGGRILAVMRARLLSLALMIRVFGSGYRRPAQLLNRHDNFWNKTMIISYTQMPTYEPAGQDLGIYWNEQFVEPEGEQSHWVYDYCLAKTTDNYAAFVSAS
jgi:hypothetical protein